MRVWLVWKSFLLFGSQEWKQGGWVTTGIMSTFQFMSHQMYPVGRVGYDRDRISRGCCSCSCSLAWHASQGPQPRPTAPSTWTVLTGRGRGGLRNMGGGRGVHGAVACKRRWRNQQHWRCSGDGPLTLSPSDLDVLTAASAYNLATWTCLDSQCRPPTACQYRLYYPQRECGFLPACPASTQLPTGRSDLGLGEASNHLDHAIMESSSISFWFGIFHGLDPLPTATLPWHRVFAAIDVLVQVQVQDAFHLLLLVSFIASRIPSSSISVI